MTPEQKAALDAAEAEAESLESDADKAALSPIEEKMAEARARAEAAKEKRAAAEQARRALDMATRLRAAEQKAGRAYIVTGIDLVSLFPLGKSPPPDQLPGRGVIIVRDAADQESDLIVEVEHKSGPGAKRIDKVLIEIAIKSTVDPEPSDETGRITLRGFCERYTAAAIQIANEARRLGGAKVREAKRGRE
jgi:hypothetical protein